MGGFFDDLVREEIIGIGGVKKEISKRSLRKSISRDETRSGSGVN